MTTNKISALFMILAITLSIIGFTYAHWTETLQITGTVKMAHLKLTITSYKNLTSQEVKQYSNITSQLSADGHTLTLTCDGLRPCWFIWIGLVTQNQGSLPANLKPPEYSFDDPDGFGDYFNTTEYFYGPYPENTGYGNLEVWGKVKVSEDGPLKPDGTTTFITPPNATSPPPFEPISVDPGEKAVIWIWIHLHTSIPDNAQNKTITMYIDIVDDIAI